MRTINSSIAIDYYPYKYSFIFFFEEKYFNEAYMSNLVMWIKNHWWWSVVYAVIYMVLVYYGQKWMANRERFHLYRSLVAWNVVLAVFSILGAVRFLPNFITVLADKGTISFFKKQLYYHEFISYLFFYLDMLFLSYEYIMS